MIALYSACDDASMMDAGSRTGSRLIPNGVRSP
jgi:hypothetical protein